MLGAQTLRWAVRLVNRPVPAIDCARMAVTGILHTGLTVSDLDRSVAFYRDLLGLELIAQWDSRQPYLRAIVAYPDAELRIALLRLPQAGEGAPGHHIELLEYRRPRGQRGDVNTYNPGNGHVAFMVADIDTTYAELSAKGVRFKSAPVPITHGRNAGAKGVYLFDPDDITLEMIQPAPRP
jgi:catechol 2,3-dioxygenase-like lactoylglutathione lyase family enzyme